jgi:hypothetical protein
VKREILKCNILTARPNKSEVVIKRVKSGWTEFRCSEVDVSQGTEN